MLGGSTTSADLRYKHLQILRSQILRSPTLIRNVEFCLRLQDEGGKISQSSLVQNLYVLSYSSSSSLGTAMWCGECKMDFRGGPCFFVIKDYGDLTEGARESRSKSRKRVCCYSSSVRANGLSFVAMVSHWHKDYHSRCEGCFVRPQDTDGSKKKDQSEVDKECKAFLFHNLRRYISNTPHTHTQLQQSLACC